MHEYILRNWRLVKVATTKAQRKLFFNLRSMKGSTALSAREARRHRQRRSASSPRRWSRWRRAWRAATWRSTRRRATRRRRRADRVPDRREDEPAQILEREQTARTAATGLQRALAKLDDRSRRIIEARWLREDDPATLQDLADEYGVSAERIRQIESKAMKTMRSQMAAAA